MDLGMGAIDTPLGRMVVTASEEGVRRLEWGDGPENDLQIGRKHVEATREWVRAFFQRREVSTPVLDRSGLTAFQEKVLGALSRSRGSARSSVTANSRQPPAARTQAGQWALQWQEIHGSC